VGFEEGLAILVIVGVGESLTNWLFWAWGEFVKLVIVGVGERLTNWLLWAWRRV
jgi:Flp pilus assembly pilin Flp